MARRSAPPRRRSATGPRARTRACSRSSSRQARSRRPTAPAGVYDWPIATKVKICGITNLEDAQAAAGLGAWALGMIFAESPRRCEVGQAAEVAAALRRQVKLVGVFVNAPLDEILSVLESAPLSILQLHGDEGPSYCDEARRRTGLQVMKAARVRDRADVRALSAYRTDYHLLDAHVPGQ